MQKGVVLVGISLDWDAPDRYKAGGLFEWDCGKEMKKQQPIKEEINIM